MFIPVQPSPYDVWAANEILELFKQSDVYKPDVKRAFVINRKIANTAIGRDVNEALSEYHLLVLNAAVCQRVSFADSATLGKTVFDNDPEGLSRPGSDGAGRGDRGVLRMSKKSQLQRQAAVPPERRRRRCVGVDQKPKPVAEPVKRFTFEVPFSLHKRIKMTCAAQDRQMAEVVRELLEKHFPEE